MNEPDRDPFVQEKLHWRVGCELVDDGLLYEHRSLLTRSATRVPFESIPDDPIRESRISRFWALAVSASFFGFLFALKPLAAGAASPSWPPLVASLAALAVSAAALRARSGHFIVFPCEGKRVVFREVAGDASLAAFLEQLQIKKTKYLSETYGPRPTEPDDERRDFGAADETEDDPGGYRH